jgi:hypothetical protein
VLGTVLTLLVAGIGAYIYLMHFSGKIRW